MLAERIMLGSMLILLLALQNNVLCLPTSQRSRTTLTSSKASSSSSSSSPSSSLIDDISEGYESIRSSAWKNSNTENTASKGINQSRTESNKTPLFVNQNSFLFHRNISNLILRFFGDGIRSLKKYTDHSRLHYATGQSSMDYTARLSEKGSRSSKTGPRSRSSINSSSISTESGSLSPETESESRSSESESRSPESWPRSSESGSRLSVSGSRLPINGSRFIRPIQAHRGRRSVDTELWQPVHGTREEYLRTRGLYGEWDEVEKLKQLYGIDQPKTSSNSTATFAAHDLQQLPPLDCTGIVYTLQQLKQAIAINGISPKTDVKIQERNKKRKKRQKRSIENFDVYPYLKWNNPIFYKFDGEHDSRDMDIIRGAIRHWEMNTCIRFFEVTRHSFIGDAHLLFTARTDGCYSNVGRVFYEQQINLAPRCLDQFGTAVHEIGHALGLWHEHQRIDRDDWVSIIEANINGVESQFFKHSTKNLSLPYDYGSVMQYSATAGSVSRQITIQPKDNLYLYSMGQRTGLSYLDAKNINLEYCMDKCKPTPLAYPCLNGGYQDPFQCEKCICPDGFGGDYCEHFAYPVAAVCGGELTANSTVQYIQSPGYDTIGYYKDYIQCSWVIQAQRGHRVRAWFEGEFGLFFFSYDSCFHWVEIKYKDDFQFAGPRFCGYETPPPILVSEGGRMMVLLRTNYTSQSTARRGFKLAYTQETDPDYPSREHTVTSPRPSHFEPYGTSWSEWGACRNHYCQCGGCSQRQRYRICGRTRCKEMPLAAVETEPCDKPCDSNDTWFNIINNLILPKDCPVCCDGFQLSGNRCVKTLI